MSKKMNLREIKNEAEAIAAEATEERHPVIEREVTLTIKYDAPDGQCYESDIVSRVMGGEEKRVRAAVFSKLLNGIAPSTLANEDYYRYDAIARAMVQIKDIPEWLEEFMQMDNELLASLHKALGEHESAYFRGNSVKSEEGKGKPRVLLTTPFDK